MAPTNPNLLKLSHQKEAVMIGKLFMLGDPLFQPQVT